MGATNSSSNAAIFVNLKFNMILQIDELLAVPEPFSFDAKFLKYREIDIAGCLAFANDMTTVI